MSLLTTIADSHLTVKLDRSYTNFNRTLKKVKKENQEKYHNQNITSSATLFKSARFTNIINTSNTTYIYHIGLTKSWLIEGLRLLPSTMAETYIKRMRENINRHQEAVDEFITNWDEELATAQLQAGDVVNDIQWPTKTEFKAAFDINYYFIPVGDTFTDTIVLPQEEFDALNNKIEEWNKSLYGHFTKQVLAEIKEIRDKITTQKHREDSIDTFQQLVKTGISEINKTTVNQEVQDLFLPVLDTWNSRLIKKYATDSSRFITALDEATTQFNTLMEKYA